MPRLVLVPADAPDIVGVIAAIRAAGDVPLVSDPRMPRALRRQVDELAAGAVLDPETAWTTTTSGSTGNPRLVVRTARSWESSFATVADLLGATETDTILLPAPASSSLTLFSLAHALAGGPRPAVAARTATLFHGTPALLRRVLAHDEAPRLRAALVGGDTLDPELRARAEGRGIRMVSYYGAAELSFVAVDSDGTGLRAFPGVDVEVRRRSIWVRSPYVAQGYLGAPGPLRRDGDWAGVGDTGAVADGVLRLSGRRDAAIQTAGATVVPAEVERVLRRLPGVEDVVVFGLRAPGIGALVGALVEPSGGAVLQRANLRAAADAALAVAHRPRVWFVGDIPRTASGKPRRREVERRADAGELARA